MIYTRKERQSSAIIYDYRWTVSQKFRSEACQKLKNEEDSRQRKIEQEERAYRAWCTMHLLGEVNALLSDAARLLSDQQSDTTCASHRSPAGIRLPARYRSINIFEFINLSFFNFSNHCSVTASHRSTRQFRNEPGDQRPALRRRYIPRRNSKQVFWWSVGNDEKSRQTKSRKVELLK